MQEFWYHSPVRFYKTMEEHSDMTNPQNTQFFGTKRPYPLEKGAKHRFPIPAYNNFVERGVAHHVYLNNGDSKTLVGTITEGKGIINESLIYVDVFSDQAIKGHLEVVNSQNGKVEFYSNCVEFLDSTDADGRKMIRVATKHTYNRHLFNFENPAVWLVTNLPAYCLGNVRIEAEISNNRIGGRSTLRIKESHIDEVVSYEFTAGGDANILNFIQVHATNNLFFIDGTQRTCLDKLDASDFAMSGKINFTNVKNHLGLNITIDETHIFN